MKPRTVLIGALVVGGAAAWMLSAPARTPASDLDGLPLDAARGEYVFTAAGCASCHQTPDVEVGVHLGGGLAFASDFGTFYAPNISPSEAGIGGWEPVDLVNALRHGTSPDGQHYYPAFPYTSYQNMTNADAVAVYAYLQTVPEVDTPSRAHDVGFPFNMRRSLGGWKLLFMRSGFVGPADTAEQEQGRYIAEALAHCAECHTPRNGLGAMNRDAWLTGAPNPSGRGTIPDISNTDWSDADLMAYFTTGFTPDYDVVGGSMAHVVENLSQLPEADRQAIIAYLRAL